MSNLKIQYFLRYLFLMLSFFFPILSSVCFAENIDDIKSVIVLNRQLIKNVDVEIAKYQGNDKTPAFEERWIILEDKFRHEWCLDFNGQDTNARSEWHIHTSDGQVEMRANYHEKRGVIQSAAPQTEFSPTKAPWRLFGVTGAGLGDPVSWLEEDGVKVQKQAGGVIQLEIPGKTVPLRVGNTYLEYKSYEKRIVTLDMNRGGVVISLEDIDNSNKVLRRTINSDIICSKNGGWIPRKTVFKKYINGLLIKNTNKQVELGSVSGIDRKKSFRIKFPDNFHVVDHMIDPLAVSVMYEVDKLSTEFIEEMKMSNFNVVEDSKKTSKQALPIKTDKLDVIKDASSNISINSENESIEAQEDSHEETGRRRQQNQSSYVAGISVICLLLLAILLIFKKLYQKYRMNMP